MEICNVWKELNKEHEEIVSLLFNYSMVLQSIIFRTLKIAFLGTQVLAPTETNLDQDSKILTVKKIYTYC